MSSVDQVQPYNGTSKANTDEVYEGDNKDVRLPSI